MGYYLLTFVLRHCVALTRLFHMFAQIFSYIIECLKRLNKLFYT